MLDIEQSPGLARPEDRVDPLSRRARIRSFKAAAAVIVPGRSPASTWTWRTQPRSVSELMPSWSPTRLKRPRARWGSFNASRHNRTAHSLSSSGCAGMIIIRPWNQALHHTRDDPHRAGPGPPGFAPCDGPDRRPPQRSMTLTVRTPREVSLHVASMSPLVWRHDRDDGAKTDHVPPSGQQPGNQSNQNTQSSSQSSTAQSS